MTAVFEQRPPVTGRVTDRVTQRMTDRVTQRVTSRVSPHVTRRACSAAVDSQPSGITSTESLTIPETILDGGEIVLLAIKPSLWFILFDSARWIVVGAILIVAPAVSSLSLFGLTSKGVAQLGLLCIAVRCAVGLLRWVSRFYVLTNRRIMRLRGVFHADIKSCSLLEIRNTRITVAQHERVTRLGTILFFSETVTDPDFHWFNISKAEEVHQHIRRAIERAIDSQPRC